MPDVEVEIDDDERDNTLLYVFLVLYFIGMVGIAGVAFMRKQAALAQGADLQAQFGGSFSAPLLVLTTFSTIFSGYTVTGVPADAVRRGFGSYRWVACVMGIVAGFLLYFPRLRRLSVKRGYVSPGDFITDRYRSKATRLLAFTCMCIPQMLYLTVQFVSFDSVLGSFLDFSEWMDRAAMKTVLMTFFGVCIIGMEFLGGMNSVVLTDAVQSVVMIAAFIVIPFVVWYHYGPMWDMVAPDCSYHHYVIQDPTASIMTAPLRFNCTGDDCAAAAAAAKAIPAGCAAAVRPDLLTYPPAGAIFPTFFFFVFNQMAFSLNPHVVQRCFIAKNDYGLKVVAGTLILSAFIAMLPGVYLGITSMAYSPSWPQATRDMSSTFAQIGEELMKKGGFEYMLVTLMMCSSLAAVMSSADSVMMGVSSTIAIDMVQGLSAPDIEISAETTVHIGELVSVVQVLVAIFAGRMITPPQFIHLLLAQNGILAQVVPAFMLGLFTKVSARSITAGMFAGLATVVLLIFAFSNPFGAICPDANLGLAINVIVVAITNVVAPGPDKWVRNLHYIQLEHKYGGPMLTPEDIDECCADMKEPPPMLPILMLCVALLASPLWAEDGSEVGMLMGLPSWAVWSLIWSVVSAAIGYYAIFVWEVPEGDKADPTGEMPPPRDTVGGKSFELACRNVDPAEQ